MPAPKPPKLTAHPSARELKRASQQIAAISRLTAERPLVLAQSPAGYNLSLDTSGDFFLARLTGVYTPTGGVDAGINLYSFIEQSFDPETGLPLDAIPNGRQTYPAAPSQPESAYAIEDNNVLLTVPGSTPTGYSNAGPYVQIRLKGYVAGAPVYQFNYHPFVVNQYTASLSPDYAVTTSWANVTGTGQSLQITLPANKAFFLSAQVCGSITSSSTGIGDFIKVRLCDGTNVYGAVAKLCYAVCDSITFHDSAPLVAITPVLSSSTTISVQAQLVTTTASTGTLFATGDGDGGCYLTAVALN